LISQYFQRLKLVVVMGMECVIFVTLEKYEMWGNDDDNYGVADHAAREVLQYISKPIIMQLI
jgi:hypothetical protein